MEYTIKTMAATIFVGAMTRIRKNKTKETADFWQYFSSNNFIARIDNLLAPRIVAMYSNYNLPGEDCTFWLGGLVSHNPKSDTSIKYKKIPEQAYAIFRDIGIPAEITPTIWKKVEKRDLDRSYVSDFEVYKPIGEGNFEIEIYVSLN
jgi:predicted transcriptional regulator YdeE